MDLAAARLGRCPLAKLDYDCFKNGQKKRQTNDAGAGRLGLDIFVSDGRVHVYPAQFV